MDQIDTESKYRAIQRYSEVTPRLVGEGNYSTLCLNTENLLSFLEGRFNIPDDLLEEVSPELRSFLISLRNLDSASRTKKDEDYNPERIKKAYQEVMNFLPIISLRLKKLIEEVRE